MPPPPTRSELLKGARLGSYEVGALIGHGGMASVFEGTNVGLGKPVAIKVLHEHVAQSEPMRARFLREARLAATLEHPHVVTILDVGVEGDLAYLVMERLTGQDLAATLRSVGKLPLPEALAILFPVASALAFAHDQGVVHRDLKPANVFVARDRHGEPLPKIVDFGLSKLVTAFEPHPLTEEDVVIGTLEYMAPEQTFGATSAGPKADQYSLGAILYETLTGHLPFEWHDTRQLLDAIRYAPVLPPSAAEPSLPPELDDVVIRALARDPDHRFDDVREMARALQPLADPKTVRLWERDFAQPSRKWVVVDLVGPDTETDTTLAGVPPPPPPLPSEPGASTLYVRGIAYRGVVRLVELKVPRGLVGLDEELADARIAKFVRRPFLPASRYDVLPMLPINVAIARILGKSLDRLAFQQGTAQARHDTRYAHKRFFDAMTLETIQAHLVRFYEQYYDNGETSAELVAPGHVLLHRRRLPAYVLPWLAPAHVAYAEELVRLKGARTVEASTRPPTGAGSRRGVEMVDLDVDLRWHA
jgi:serine/threonine protein kinase